jgi:AcrR family transcriptional regulator
MPYPTQITHESIIHKAVELIEQEGVEQLALGKLATALGVKAPSLYRYVNNKDALLQAVNLQTIQGLFAAYEQALAGVDDVAAVRLTAVLHTHRTFALTHPQCYMLALANPIDAQRPDEDLLTQMVLPIQTIVAEIAGETQSLAALRGALALVHGFVLLELNNQLRRGGDLTAAFSQSITAYIKGWQTVIGEP